MAQGQFAQLRRYWWVVLVVTALAMAAAVYATVAVSTNYTGRASLIVSSNDRSPDQDAVLVQGYVSYFNDNAYQDQLVTEAGVKEKVTLTARAAAASPILLIESTASTSPAAETSAAAVATAFQSDINRVQDTKRQDQLKQLQQRISDITTAGGADAASSIATLQQQVSQVEGDRVNQLQVLQLRGGVSTNAPSGKTNLAFGLFGGLLLGVLAALALARVVALASRRRYVRGA